MFYGWNTWPSVQKDRCAKTIFISHWLNSAIRNSAWVQVRHVPLSAGRPLFVSRNIYKCRVIIKPGNRDREDKMLPLNTSPITPNKAASTATVAKLQGETVICIRHYSLTWQWSKVRFSVHFYISVSHKISNRTLAWTGISNEMILNWSQ